MSADQDTFMNGIEILTTDVATSSSGSLYTLGGISILNTTNASSTSASFLTLGGIFIKSNTIIGGNTIILSTTISTNTTTGAFIVNGGIGISGSVFGNFADFSNIQATIGATLPNLIVNSASIGSLSLSAINLANITTNNLVVLTSSISNAIFTNITSTNLSSNIVTINSTTDSSRTSGSLITNGGISVGKSVYIGSTVNATNTSTGALIVSGGGVFNGDIYAKNIYTNGVLTIGTGVGSYLFGTEYNYVELLATSGTTNTNFQQRVSMTTSSLLGGTYKINIGYTFDVPSVNNQDGIFNVLLDPTNLTTGTLIHEHIERKDKTNYVIPQYNSISRVLTPGIHFVSLLWKSGNNGSVIFISNARLELFRAQ